MAESKADAKPSRSSAGDEEVDVGATLGWEEEVGGWPRWWEEGLQGKIMEEETQPRLCPTRSPCDVRF